MKAFVAFILGIVVGILVQRFVLPISPRTVGSENSATAPAVNAPVINFDSEKIKEELAHTGQVIREKARVAGAAIADTAANARITATIKGKLIKESNLAAFKIDVDTNDGVVTLSGTVNSSEEIAQAMRLAFETEGVHKVVSSLQVKAK